MSKAKLIKPGAQKKPLDQRIVKPQPAERITAATVAQWTQKRQGERAKARAAFAALFAGEQK